MGDEEIKGLTLRRGIMCAERRHDCSEWNNGCTGE